jgi:hypothetical protein
MLISLSLKSLVEDICFAEVAHRVAPSKHEVRVLPLAPALTDTGHIELNWRQRAVMVSNEAASLHHDDNSPRIHPRLLPLRDPFGESFSGPGSYSRTIATLFVLGNLENVAFV